MSSSLCRRFIRESKLNWDANSYWTSIQEAYEAIEEIKYKKLGTDGRVDILKKIL
jgi:hypothetical protein